MEEIAGLTREDNAERKSEKKIREKRKYEKKEVKEEENL